LTRWRVCKSSGGVRRQRVAPQTICVARCVAMLWSFGRGLGWPMITDQRHECGLCVCSSVRSGAGGDHGIATNVMIDPVIFTRARVCCSVRRAPRQRCARAHGSKGYGGCALSDVTVVAVPAPPHCATPASAALRVAGCGGRCSPWHRIHRAGERCGQRSCVAVLAMNQAHASIRQPFDRRITAMHGVASLTERDIASRITTWLGVYVPQCTLPSAV
jgi:hypothetical protein